MTMKGGEVFNTDTTDLRSHQCGDVLFSLVAPADLNTYGHPEVSTCRQE